MTSSRVGGPSDELVEYAKPSEANCSAGDLPSVLIHRPLVLLLSVFDLLQTPFGEVSVETTFALIGIDDLLKPFTSLVEFFRNPV